MSAKYRPDSSMGKSLIGQAKTSRYDPLSGHSGINLNCSTLALNMIYLVEKQNSISSF